MGSDTVGLRSPPPSTWARPHTATGRNARQAKAICAVAKDLRPGMSAQERRGRPGEEMGAVAQVREVRRQNRLALPGDMPVSEELP